MVRSHFGSWFNRLFMAAFALVAGQQAMAQPCNLGFSFASFPPPDNGTYAGGTVVQFCYTMTDWNIDATNNWFHGITLAFGPGWDQSTLSPGAPPFELSGVGGTWGWYPAVQGTSAVNVGVVGPGFFYDLDNNGDPGDNLGDQAIGGPWQFCWTITVAGGANCVDGADLSVTVSSFGDSQTGSWDTPGCIGDPAGVLAATSICCQPTYAGEDGVVNVCGTDGPIDLMNYIGGVPDLGGTWTDPFLFPTTSTFDPSFGTPGVYTYTAPAPAGCVADEAYVTVNVDVPPVAGIDGSVTLCAVGVPENLLAYLGGAVPGGTWTDPNNQPFSGFYDPAVQLPGVYVYSIQGQGACSGSASASVTVTETSAPNAGSDGALTTCDNALPLNLFAQLGGTPEPNGTWSGPLGANSGTLDPATDPSGAYVYTVVGNAPCPNAQATVDVTVNQAPQTLPTSVGSYCSLDPAVDLYAIYMSLLPNTGTWTDPNGTVFNGTLQPFTAVSGDYQYTLAGTLPCLDGVNHVDITINPSPDAGTNGNLVICSSVPPLPLTSALQGTPDANGTWTDPNGQIYPATFDPATAINGVYTYNVAATPFCPGATATVNVNVVTAVDAGLDASVSACENDPNINLFNLLGGTPDANGDWATPNGTPMNGVIDPTTAASGDYTYTVQGINPCPDVTSIVSVDVQQLPEPGSDNSVAVCADSTVQDLFALLGATADAGGFWTAPDGSTTDSLFDPANDPSGTYIYHILGTGACLGDTLVAEIDATSWPLPVPSFTLDTVSGCVPVTINFEATDPTILLAQWQFGDGALDNGVPSTQYTYEEPGYYDVTLSVVDGNGCSTSITDTAAVAVFALPDPHFTSSPNPTTAMVTDIALDAAVEDYPIYRWTSNSAEIGDTAVFTYHFPTLEADVYNVCLHVVDTNACENEFCDLVVVQQQLEVNVPNTFTPDGNGVNEEFAPVLLGVSDQEYEFVIFDRWGQIVFETQDPSARWNGGFRNGGTVLPTGVYSWRLRLREDISPERKDIFGHVTLLK